MTIERIVESEEKLTSERITKTLYLIVGGIAITTLLASFVTGLYIAKKLNENYSNSGNTQKAVYQINK